MSLNIDPESINTDLPPPECPLTLFDGRPADWEDAVRVLLEVERVVESIGAHTALTGGCIYKGHSDKDIDIIIYPHQTDSPPTKDAILHALRENMELLPVNGKGYWYFQTNTEYLDKDVVIVNVDGFRVDLFFFLII